MMSNECIPSVARDPLAPQHRPSRNTGQASGGGEYVGADGTPLYVLKKRNPLGYGRKRRDTEKILHRVPR